MDLTERRTRTVLSCVVTIAVVCLKCVHATTSYTELTFLEEPSDLVVSRGNAATLHCSVQSEAGMPNVIWMKDGKPLGLDDQNILWPNGSLHITNVDGSNRGLYQCMVTLPQTGAIISRFASLHTAYLSRNFIREPQDLTIYLQEVAMFECEGDGLPAPNVTWYKDNSLLRDFKPNILVYPDGVLEINPVEFSDFGTYYCQVENTERARSSRLAKLEQNGNTDFFDEGTAPWFVATPRDTSIPEGSSTILFCGANGFDTLRKKPEITWLKDGETIIFNSTQGRLKLKGAGSLQIFNVQPSDAGTYSCRSNNLEDSIDAEATLTVLVRPHFETKPQSVMAYEKTEAIFNCKLKGSPAPEVRWTKDGLPLQASNYIIENEDHLRIMGLVTSDSGYYQCHGSNELGSIQAIAQLVVLPNTLATFTDSFTYISPNGGQRNLPSKPTGLAAAIVSKRFITLRWDKHDDGGTTGYTVFWREQGSLRERMLNTTQPEATLQRLNPDSRYQIQVRAFNRFQYSWSYASIEVDTEKDVAVPSPPVNFRVAPQSPESILVTWDPPQQPKGQILKYLLSYEDAHRSPKQIEVLDTRKLLTGLMAFRTYTVRVVAVNENGVGMSTREMTTKTFSDKPSEAPQNATLETASSTSLIVRWEPPTVEHQNGKITGYKIRYKMKGASRNGATVTTDGNRRLYALTNLEKMTEYQVRISALTVNGSGPLTPKLKATTYEDDLDESKVPDAPRTVIVTPHATSIRVSWTTPPPENKIVVRGYVLGWGKGVPDSERKILGPDTQIYTIENLIPSSEYVITVRAMNNKGEGMTRYTTAITTKESVEEPLVALFPPVGLKTMVLSSSTIVLTWTDTSIGPSQKLLDNRYYTVRYRLASEAENNNNRYLYLNSTDLNAHIDHLLPNSKYDFDVRITKGRSLSPWSMKESNKTMEDVPATAPVDLTPVPKKNDPRAVIMNWQPPAKPNGQITGYLVFYTTDPKQELREWVVDGVLEGDELSATIKRLTPSTTYYFKVQARNSKGYGPLSETVIYKTPQADGSGGGQIDPEYPRISPGEKGTIPELPGLPEFPESPQKPNRRAVDEGSGIREKLDSGQTKIMETGAFDEGSGIIEELDGGQTKMMETGEIHRSKPEIFRFEPITSEKLKDLLKYFKVEYPEDPFSESFVRQIIQEDMLRKLETAVESLSIGIVLTKNIPTKRHDLPSVEAFVLEVDVVYGGDQFRATIKEDFDDVAKFIGYQMLSSYCTLVESVTIAFTMDLPKMISEHPVEFLTAEKIKHFFSELFERIEDKDVRSMERNRHWRAWVTGEILKKVMTNGKSICADAWVKIDDVCQKTLQDLNCILSELEEFRTKVLPANQNKLAVEEGSAIMEELDSGQTTIMETGAVEEGSAIMEELDSGQTTIMETGAVDEGSDIIEELDSGQTTIMETGAVDEGSGIIEELDGGQTKMMETGDIVDEMIKTTGQGTVKANYPESVVDNLPKEMPLGVYYGWGSVDNGEVYKMVLSVGWNLYYKNTKKSMETYLMHTFNEDFYGSKLKVVMLGYIRPMKDFSSLDELVKAIENNIYVAKQKLDQPENLRYKTNNFFSTSGGKSNEEAEIPETNGPSHISR